MLGRGIRRTGVKTTTTTTTEQLSFGVLDEERVLSATALLSGVHRSPGAL